MSLNAAPTMMRLSLPATWTPGAARAVGAAWMALVALVSCPTGAEPLQTPLEQAGYRRITRAAEVRDFFDALERHDGPARRVGLGVSPGGRPIDALVVSESMKAMVRGDPPAERLRVMVVGSQHGGEPSGAEAILMLARDLVTGSERALLADMEFILVPVGNPDGREAGKRENSIGIDVATDNLTLSQPETRAIFDALNVWKPDAVIDLHESAVFKHKTLAREGYMTDFETQIETANNPNVDPALAALARERIVPAIFARLRNQGLEADWYVAEITSIDKPIKHGGVTIKTLRNRAGIDGALSLLVEGRLDPAAGTYPTPHNIRARATKQLMTLQAWIAVILQERHEIAARSRAARAAWRNPGAPEQVSLFAGYGPAPGRDTISIRLRRISDGQLENRTFAYLGRIVQGAERKLPAAYVVTAHQAMIARLLDRQHIRYETFNEARQCEATVPHVSRREPVPGRRGEETWHTEIDERKALVTLPAGTLRVPLEQPARRLIPLLLELRSNSSIFEHPSAVEDYSRLVVAGRDFFVLRVDACPAGKRKDR